jgi:F-type H+-transporting ATPase subunit a
VTSKERGTGINRWLIVLLIVAAVVLSGIVPPIKPAVFLPGEALTGPLFNVMGQPFYITNTLLTAWIGYLLIIILAFFVRRSVGKDGGPSRGVAAVFEPIVEALGNLTESTAGSQWARRFFPWVAAIIIVVLVANLLKLLPGFESIGWLHDAHEEGYPAVEVVPGVFFLVQKDSAEEAAGTTAEEGEHSEEEHLYEVVPFFRGASTDLNFTLAIALTTMVMVQVFGVMSNGAGYFSKFFNFGPFLRIWNTKKLGPFDVITPFIDIFVGILELISEFAKIISFSFRLLGAMFGGAILFGVIATLLPPVAFAVYFLELFFGSVQALVFGVLALVFMTVAIQSHGHGDEHAEAH